MFLSLPVEYSCQTTQATKRDKSEIMITECAKIEIVNLYQYSQERKRSQVLLALRVAH